MKFPFASSEKTPLVGTSGRHNSNTTSTAPISKPPTTDVSKEIADVKTAMKTLVRPENMEHARTIASQHIDQLATTIQRGDISIRFMGMLGGFALLGASLLGIFARLATLHWSSALMDLYIASLGVVMLILESRQLPFPDRWVHSIYKYAYLFKFVWGRGGLYFVAGSLAFAQGTITDLWVGGFVMLIGLVFILVGRHTEKKLHQLRQILGSSEQTVKVKFDEADTQKKGYLTLKDFRHLTHSLMGIPWNLRETEAAYLVMDSSDDGRVTYQEFKSWWSAYGDGAAENVSVV